MLHDGDDPVSRCVMADAWTGPGKDREYARGAVLMYVFMVEGAARELRTLWDLEKVEAEEAERGCWPSLFIEFAGAGACEGGGREGIGRADNSAVRRSAPLSKWEESNTHVSRGRLQSPT